MADRKKTGIGPCDWCGSLDDCRCPPCPCKWCKYERGEATEFETAQVEAHLDQLRKAELAESAAKMQRNIDAGGA
ncbi:hypothetical protein [Nostoc phage Nsp-JY21]